MPPRAPRDAYRSTRRRTSADVDAPFEDVAAELDAKVFHATFNAGTLAPPVALPTQSAVVPRNSKLFISDTPIGGDEDPILAASSSARVWRLVL